MCVCVCVCVREREREREKQSKKEREISERRKERCIAGRWGFDKTTHLRQEIERYPRENHISEVLHDSKHSINNPVC